MSEIAAADVPPPPPPEPPETHELRPPDTPEARPNPADDFDPMADLAPADMAPPVEADTVDDHAVSQDSERDDQHGELDPMDHLEPADPETVTEPGDAEAVQSAIDEHANDQPDNASSAAETARPVEADAPGEPSPDSADPGADEPTPRTTEADTAAEHPQGTDPDVYDPLSQIDQQHEEPPAGPGEDSLPSPTEAPAIVDPVPAGIRSEEAGPDHALTGDQTTVDDVGAESPDTPAAETADEPVARYAVDDLNPTGNRSSIYGTELMSGPDGRDHFPGDRIGTFRDSEGRLHDSETLLFAKDDNPQPTAAMQRRADLDLDNSRPYSTKGDGESSSVAELPEGAQDVQARVAERREIVERRAEIWNDLKPLATKLGEATNQTIGAKDFHTDRLDELLDQAEPHLTRAERLEFADLGEAYIESSNELNRASERLGTAGGAFARAQGFPDSQPVTGGDGLRGSAGNLDTIAYLDGDPPTLLTFEEKGAGGTLGSRIVVDPTSPDGAHVRAEQGSPEYLRHMLQHDNKLTEAARADPALTAKLQAAVDSGNVRYLLVHTSPDGTVTVTDFRLDPGRIRLDNLRILRDRGTDDR